MARLTSALAFKLFALLITVLPAAVVLLDRSALTPFWFLAGDAYLYLGIAQASSGLGFSFDGAEPTNGFHPLWQAWLRVLTVALPGGPMAVMHATLWSALALVAVGVLTLGGAIARITGSWALALLVAPGVWFLALGQGFGNLPVWQFLDGMEAALAFALAGMLALTIAWWPGPQASALRHLKLGALLAALVLTRLDEAFLVAAIALTIFLWPGTGWLRRFAMAALVALPGALAVAAYIGWSYATTGLLFPVSGAAKGEGGLLGNLWVTAAIAFSPLQDLRAALTGYELDRATLHGAAFRVVQLIVPALYAALWVWVIRRWFRAEPWAVLMVGLGLGVILKAAYNFGFVNFWHQAYWYYAVAMMATTLATAALLAPAYRRLVIETRSTAPLTALALGGFALLQASLWGPGLLLQERHAVKAQFWEERDATRAAIAAAAPDAGLLEFGDGAINFMLYPIPVRHGFVFAGDAGSLRALQAGQLLAASHADGFRVLTSYEYLHVPPGAEDWDSATIRAFLQGSVLDSRVRAELERFEFSMLKVWRPGEGAPGVPFIGFEPRGATPPQMPAPEPQPQPATEPEGTPPAAPASEAESEDESAAEDEAETPAAP